MPRAAQSVLIANNHRRLIGGVERYIDTQVGLLASAGFRVRRLAADPAVDEVEHSRAEIVLPGRRVADESIVNGLRSLYRTTLNAELLGTGVFGETDLVHLHLFDVNLTDAIVEVFARRRIPIVHTVHDYRSICPVATMHNGERVCTSCVRRPPFGVVRHRCNRGSLPRSVFSGMNALASRVSRIQRAISHFVSPSHYVASALVGGGTMTTSEISVIPYAHAIAPDPVRIEDEPFVLFAGRLHHTKGIRTLLRAAERLPDVRFHIAGTGDEESAVREAEAHGAGNVHHLGFLEEKTLFDQMSRALCLVIPSEWHDNQPLAIIEAQSRGLPVIATRMGGMPEMIRDGVDGLLVDPGDAEALAACIRQLWENPAAAAEMGQSGHELARRRYDPQRHLEALETVYARVS